MIRWLAGSVSILAFASTTGTLATPQTQSDCLPYVSCDAATSRILNAVMKHRGGRERLHAIKSVLVEGNRRLSSGTSFLFTYRLLLPRQFQEVSQITFTVDGTTFWSRPATRADAVDRLRDVKTRLFAEQSLLLLLRGVPSLPIQAELTTTDWNAEKRPAVRFSTPGGFDLTLVLNKTGDEAAGFLQPGSYGAPTGEIKTVVRHVEFLEFERVDGISIPVKMKETIAGSVAHIDLTRTRFNAEVTADQFRNPGLF